MFSFVLVFVCLKELNETALGSCDLRHLKLFFSRVLKAIQWWAMCPALGNWKVEGKLSPYLAWIPLSHDKELYWHWYRDTHTHTLSLSLSLTHLLAYLIHFTLLLLYLLTCTCMFGYCPLSKPICVVSKCGSQLTIEKPTSVGKDNWRSNRKRKRRTSLVWQQLQWLLLFVEEWYIFI